MITDQNTNPMNLVRFCVVCERKLNIRVYPNKTYDGGHFFGKVELRNSKKAEYWECNKCFNN